ncbi:MAG: DUF3788 family protein [Candidatus Fimivivens sp.]|nr:DUF3788 family protein [Candidatus Fimivivens sp.]
MEQQLLRNPNVVPTSEIISEGLGSVSGVYTKFIERLKQYDVSLMDWRFYNDGKAWLSKGEYKWTTKRGTNKVKPLFWLSIWEGFFKVSFNFKLETKEELLNLPISDESKDIIKNVEASGKTMKFIPVIFDVDDEKQLNDIYVLMQFRKEKI